MYTSNIESGQRRILSLLDILEWSKCKLIKCAKVKIRKNGKFYTYFDVFLLNNKFIIFWTVVQKHENSILLNEKKIKYKLIINFLFYRLILWKPAIISKIISED